MFQFVCLYFGFLEMQLGSKQFAEFAVHDCCPTWRPCFCFVLFREVKHFARMGDISRSYLLVCLTNQNQTSKGLFKSELFRLPRFKNILLPGVLTGEIGFALGKWAGNCVALSSRRNCLTISGTRFDFDYLSIQRYSTGMFQFVCLCFGFFET